MQRDYERVSSVVIYNSENLMSKQCLEKQGKGFVKFRSRQIEYHLILFPLRFSVMIHVRIFLFDINVNALTLQFHTIAALITWCNI